LQKAEIIKRGAINKKGLRNKVKEIKLAEANDRITIIQNIITELDKKIKGALDFVKRGRLDKDILKSIIMELEK